MISAPRFGSGIGLARVDRLLTALEIDREWLAQASINVTGSNGKGSTSAAAESIGRAHGFKTGLFTSPHLYSFTERIKIDGREISLEQFEESFERAEKASRAVCAPGEHFAGFELLFAAACELFYFSGCELCVFEAGIGGRFDPIRLTCARCAGVTSLDLEHTAILGSTLEQICLDKTDICAPGGTIFYGENCTPLAGLIRSYTRLIGLQEKILGRDVALEVHACSPNGADFSVFSADWPSQRYLMPLLGRHQANNAALALLMVEEWCKRNNTAFSADSCRQGLSEVRWPGRLEAIGKSPLTIIDVGHTPDGIRSALNGLIEAYGGAEFVLVTGVSVDKEARAIIEILAPSFSAIVCTQAYHRGRPAEEIAALAASANPQAQIYTAPAIEQAVETARTAAINNDSAIYVAGGMYVAAEYARALAGQDPRTLPHLF